MPEIPDLEAIRGFLASRLRGGRVEATELRYPWLVRSEDGLDSLTGHEFTDVRRHGKFLIFDTDDGRLMVVNSMLTGSFPVGRAETSAAAPAPASCSPSAVAISCATLTLGAWVAGTSSRPTTSTASRSSASSVPTRWRWTRRRSSPG